ncbi:MAG TPA: PAC2 family protein [Dehalococcoidia bacterium]
MDPLQVDEIPRLRNPVLVAAFAGWNDAAESATSAVQLLLRTWSARRFASIDPEEFYSFTDTRPQIRLVDGAQRSLEWPSNVFYYHQAGPSLPRDVLLLLGVEPNLRWRAFTGLILDVVRRAGASLVVTLGALLADAPHTRPVRVTGFATDPELARRINREGVTRSRYEGPTGIVGVLHDALRREGIASASLWAGVPHYVSASPNPRATAALLRRLGAVLGLDLDLSALDAQGREFDAQVNAALAESPDLAEYVRTLERRADEEGEEAQDLPSGEALFQELEEFLRRRRDEGAGGEPGPEDGGPGS